MTKKTKGERRRDAVEACRARFQDKPYQPGVRDCVKLASHALHKMGHRVGLTKGIKYQSEAGGLKVLRRLGFETLQDAMDATGRPRIAPAAAALGDILAFPSGDALGVCLFVYAGNGKALGFKEDHPCAAMIKLEIPAIAAWKL